MHPQPATASEIAALLHDIRALSDNPTETSELREAVLARKAQLLARITEQNNRDLAHTWDFHNDGPGQPSHDHDDEPYLDVRVGLIGQAIELLALCDDLLDHSHRDRVDARVRQIGSELTRGGSKWPHDALVGTARELQSILDDAGIVVDPTLRRQP
jgi:hypothetical protein